MRDRVPCEILLWCPWKENRGTEFWSPTRWHWTRNSRSTSIATRTTSAGWPQSGCDGITPNGSLGEYQTLTAEERGRLVTAAMEAAPDGFSVIPAVGAYGSRESVRWAEQAAEVGAAAVMALPPNSYRADERSVLEHYRALAAVGLPVVAYNNPLDTKVDLGPRMLARLYEEGLIVAVKEFAGDPRRAYEVRELAPELDVLIGSDDTVLEVALAGAKGWISGYTSAFPQACVEPLPRVGQRRSRYRIAAVPRAASALAVGLENRVRAGDQALDGHRRS